MEKNIFPKNAVEKKKIKYLISHVTKELREKEMMKSASKLKETSNKSIIL